MTPDELLLAVMALCRAERGCIRDRNLGMLAFRGTPTPYFRNIPQHEFLKRRKELEEQGVDMFRSYNEPASLIEERFESCEGDLHDIAAQFPFAQNMRLLYVGRAQPDLLLKNFEQIKTLIAESESKLTP
jgi:hypothetical protein